MARLLMLLAFFLAPASAQLPLGPLMSCAGDLTTSGPLATCIMQATNMTAARVDIPAIAECLEEYRTTLSANCISALEQFIVQEGQDGSLDREVADQETTESESQIEAEDEICDARLMQVCRPQLIQATFTGHTTNLAECAQQNLQVVGQACASMALHASSDGLLTHMRRCGIKAIEYCPSQALTLSAAAAQGIDNIELTAILALGSCLRDHTQQMRQGCMGFVDSVATVVSTLSSRVSEQFNREQANVQNPPTSPPAPAPPRTVVTPAPAPPSGDHGTGSKTHSKSNTHNGGQADHPSGPKSESSGDDDKDKTGLSAGWIAAISIIAVAAAVGIIGGLFWYRRRQMSSGLAEVMGLAQSGSTGVPSQLDTEIGFLHKKSAYEKLEMA